MSGGAEFSAAQVLARLVPPGIERRLAQGLGSWTLAIPEFEVKIETGRHIFWHADAANRLRNHVGVVHSNS